MKRFLSLMLCGLMLLTVTSCGTSQPDPETVGTIGETTFSAKLYRLLQLNTARANPDASEKELRQAVLEEMEHYAAVEARFQQLGGEMGEEGQAYVDQYAPTIWQQSQTEMEENGVDEATLEEYVAHLYREDSLLTMVYGKDGEQPVAEGEILDYARESLYYGVCVYLPLTGEENQSISNDDQAKEQVLAAARRIQQAASDEESMRNAASAELPQVLALTERTWNEEDLDSYVYANLFTPENWEANLSEGAMEVLRNTDYGACSVLENENSITVFLRLDPEGEYTAEDLRPYVTRMMKEGELDEALAAQGAELTHQLDESAVDAMWK